MFTGKKTRPPNDKDLKTFGFTIMGPRNPQLGLDHRQSPGGGPYFLEERELEWANATLKFSRPPPTSGALTYSRTLLFSKYPEHWLWTKLKTNQIHCRCQGA